MSSALRAVEREPSADPLLTVKDVARRLNVKESWVYGQVESDDGELPFFRVGRYIRFEASEIDDYLRRQRRGPGAGNGHGG